MKTSKLSHATSSEMGSSCACYLNKDNAQTLSDEFINEFLSASSNTKNSSKFGLDVCIVKQIYFACSHIRKNAINAKSHD